MPNKKPGRKVYTVSELNRDLKTVVETSFPSIWVEGEISNFKVYSSGHSYFTLKDKDAQLRGVMWKGRRSYLKFEPKDGDRVVCRGRLSVYEQRGEYQMVVESMEPKGLGALQAAFEQLKRKLAAEGLFDKERKKKLPYIPWSVGIITSPTGAVIRDMIRTLNRRFPGLDIVLAPVQVQGDAAAGQIAEAIADMNKYGKVDVIIAGRGGGSLEDLWAFNEEIVARAIAASKIPVVSAVGHETDFTIADFVADLRASTPTAAAEQVAPEKEALEDVIEELTRRMIVEVRDIQESLNQRVDDIDERTHRAVSISHSHARQEANGAIRHLGALNPVNRLNNIKTRFASLDRSLTISLTRLAKLKKGDATALNRRMQALKPALWIKARREILERRTGELVNSAQNVAQDCRKRAEIAGGRLGAISPLAVLKRGYSIVTSKDGRRIIKSVNDLKTGTKIKIRLSDGQAQATISGDNRERQEKLF